VMTRFGSSIRIVGVLLASGAAFAADSTKPARAGDSLTALDRALRRTGEEIARKTELFEDHSSWDRAWVAESDHFAVRTIESWFLAHDVAAGLEVMRG